MTYLRLECDTISRTFKVPEDRAYKYISVLGNLLTRNKISFSQLESIVGKLASLELAVTAGMWYCRNQYATMARAKIDSSARKHITDAYLIPISDGLKKNGTC